MKKKQVFHIFVLALIFWMALIFSFSAQTSDKSASLSGEVGRKVANIFVPGFQTWEDEKQEQFVEKIVFLSERQHILWNIWCWGCYGSYVCKVIQNTDLLWRITSGSV